MDKYNRCIIADFEYVQDVLEPSRLICAARNVGEITVDRFN